MAASADKGPPLFVTLTTDTIGQQLSGFPLGSYYIITAESGFCPACHSDLSSANITAPNSLLGHLRRSKKCISKREGKITLFGLKQPDSLLWGSVDDIMALDSRRHPKKMEWAHSVFPPNRPLLGAPPIYQSVAQWSGPRSDGYSSSSPPPSSGSSDDDGWSGSTSSSGNSSPSQSHFNTQYVMPSHPHGHPAQYALSSAAGPYDPSIRRESNSTISAADYYAQKQAKMSAGLQQINAARSANNNNQFYAAAGGPPQGAGGQYRGQLPPMYAPPSQGGMYTPGTQYVQPGYQYPAQPPYAAY